MEKIKLPNEVASIIKKTLQENPADERPYILYSVMEYLKDSLSAENWIKEKGNLIKVAQAVEFDFEEEEPEFAVGDWIHYENTVCLKRVAPIVEVQSDGFKLILTGITGKEIEDFQLHENMYKVRHATPDEIQEEKKKRFWSKLGRKVNEYRDGDIVKFGRFSRYLEVTEDRKGSAVKCRGYNESDLGDTVKNFVVINLRLVIPTEQRLDR